MIYVPVSVESPIAVKKNVYVQRGLTNNFPEIVFELHDCFGYFDLGDFCTVSAVVTNTDLESVKFSGDISVMNPHRGQIICKPVFRDFSETGINTLTIYCNCEEFDFSFQTTIFVQSVSDEILENLKEG